MPGAGRLVVADAEQTELIAASRSGLGHRPERKASLTGPLVVCVTGPRAADVVDAIHLEARTKTYVVPRHERNLMEALRVAEAVVEPAVVFLPDTPNNAADVRALYDARAILPGAGKIVVIGVLPGGVAALLQELGLWSVVVHTPGETPYDAALGVAMAAGVTS